MKSAVVVTTIHDCSALLDGYLRNFAEYGHDVHDVSFYMIPDKKTPNFRVRAAMIVPEEVQQEAFLDHVGISRADIPWNSDNRRNVGYLMALADGAEMIVSIDDDNYCQDHFDFVGQHERGLSETGPTDANKGDWFNNLELIDTDCEGIYPRGFPFYARKKEWKGMSHAEDTIVRINAGMWIGDPDLDAMSWLHNGFHAKHSWGEAILHSNVWCPINSQNTAVHRDLMGAYYFIRMVPPSDRFGDIFQGYFALKVAKHMGWTARFGSPVVLHKRNSHVYLKDVEKEIGPILLLEELLPRLIEEKLTGTTVHEAYLSLADFIERQNSEFYRETARLMRVWAQAVKTLG